LTASLEFNDSLRSHISSQLRRFDARCIQSAGRKQAAVAVTVVSRLVDANIGDIPFAPSDSNQAALILTIRATNLRAHAGQRAFPGGRIDPGETPEQAALRELQEEAGLVLEPDAALGRLDDYETRSGYVMTPVVIWGGRAPSLKASPDEVESIHRIPVSELMRQDAPILEKIPGGEYPVLKMPLGNDWIAAPTAAIAYQFREVAILGNATRVSHFDQPRFAWS
jgi:8-oxo-dGTP pyrophosphatase MutT (NUDIX family)